MSAVVGTTAAVDWFIIHGKFQHRSGVRDEGAALGTVRQVEVVFHPDGLFRAGQSCSRPPDSIRSPFVLEKRLIVEHPTAMRFDRVARFIELQAQAGLPHIIVFAHLSSVNVVPSRRCETTLARSPESPMGSSLKRNSSRAPAPAI